MAGGRGGWGGGEGSVPPVVHGQDDRSRFSHLVGREVPVTRAVRRLLRGALVNRARLVRLPAVGEDGVGARESEGEHRCDDFAVSSHRV